VQEDRTAITLQIQVKTKQIRPESQKVAPRMAQTVKSQPRLIPAQSFNLKTR